MSRKKAPCVDLKTDVHKDERFEVLGEIAGYNRYEAIGRMTALWAWCVDRGLKDAPDDADGYVVGEAIVLRFIGPRGIDALLANGCDELALGVRLRDGRFYLRGTSEYVAARRALAERSAAGGRARSDGSRDTQGKFVGGTTDDQPQAGVEPPVIQPKPAPSSSPSSSGSVLSLDLRSPELPDPRTITRAEHGTPPSMPPGDRAARRRKLHGESWGYAARKHREAREGGIDPHARDCWGVMPDARSAESQALFARIDELTEGDAPDWDRAGEVIRNRVDVAFAEARHKHKHLQFCTPMRMWNPDSFAIAKDLSPQQVAQPPRAPPQRADQPPPITRPMKTFT